MLGPLNFHSTFIFNFSQITSRLVDLLKREEVGLGRQRAFERTN